MVVFLHVFKDEFALPMGSLEFSVLGAVFSNLNFSVNFSEFGVNFFLTFGTDAFCFAHNNPPTIASIIRAIGSRIIDMVTMRSYLRTFSTVEAEVIRRMEA